MPVYRIGGTMVHLKLSGKRSTWPPPCCARIPSNEAAKPEVRCMGISSILCDWPLDGGGTCSAPLCSEHAVEVGKDLHLCPTHAPRRDELPGQKPLL